MSACCEHVIDLTTKIKAILKAQPHHFVSLEALVLHCHVCSAINVIPTDVVDRLAELDPGVERGHEDGQASQDPGC